MAGSRPLDAVVGRGAVHKLLLFHGTLQYGDNVSGSTLCEVRIEHADQLPTLFAQPIQAIIELLAVKLPAEQPTRSLKHYC